ncbi:hypothetical protein NVP1063O_106 [Vibrio phage 1.063.O._10N.261.45.C7]|nr:hypothetical protein NVP1063O_106 [Vibrio phage 1.063.O._10N.261.45.C7]
MKLYHTRKHIVTITRDSEIVDVCIYDKTGEQFVTLAEHTCSEVSDLQALKVTRKKFNI